MMMTTTNEATDDLIPYRVVMIRATDPSGASDKCTVTVNLKDVNESPEFTDSSKDFRTDPVH